MFVLIFDCPVPSRFISSSIFVSLVSLKTLAFLETFNSLFTKKFEISHQSSVFKEIFENNKSEILEISFSL